MFAECLSIPGTEDIWIEKKKFLPSRGSQSKARHKREKEKDTNACGKFCVSELCTYYGGITM